MKFRKLTDDVYAFLQPPLIWSNPVRQDHLTVLQVISTEAKSLPGRKGTG